MPGSRRRLVAPDDLVGPDEVMRLLGISESTLRRYRKTDFPEPWCELDQGPVWIAADVRAWRSPPRRGPGRPRKV